MGFDITIVHKNMDTTLDYENCKSCPHELCRAPLTFRGRDLLYRVFGDVERDELEFNNVLQKYKNLFLSIEHKGPIFESYIKKLNKIEDIGFFKWSIDFFEQFEDVHLEIDARDLIILCKCMDWVRENYKLGDIISII
jgi:hypothetical protein